MMLESFVLHFAIARNLTNIVRILIKVIIKKICKIDV